MALYRIASSYFVCGVVERQGKVVESAPIVHYMTGKSIQWVMAYCRRKEWAILPVRRRARKLTAPRVTERQT